MTLSQLQLVCDILRAISQKKTAKFAGTGIIFYTNLEMVSHTEMGQPIAHRPNLPIIGIDAISNLLAESADKQSPWHDGFHMVDSNTTQLTHVSHFISPSLSFLSSISLNERPSGARHMTAILLSATPGIDLVGVLSADDEMTIFQQGRLTSRSNKQ